MWLEPSWALQFAGLDPLLTKRASSLDRVSLVPTVDSWVARAWPPVFAALAGQWASAPEKRPSAHRYVAGYGCRALTFHFSFVDLSVVDNWFPSC
jgi:hypothetical protein